MTYVFKGGLERPGKMTRILGPWVLLSLNESHIEFQMRFRWLARLAGPWRIERSAIRRVYLGRLNVLTPAQVNFLAEENMPWTFLARTPQAVLDAAEKLGYPVRPEAPDSTA
ncbi:MULTISPECIES: hypothetical protein [Paenarthrobacter]|uniref:Uncharacterized protein n=1 Tax=Paenarthrobacter ureafaciens TaxID=37931 RepID=A0AAX3EN33_PAEUR|nr:MULTISPECIES: hypothetical protein [Paenarthrobacter]MDO5863466.1 hypothetical protein [Paenarthrobacter sp. SD-2]MDO5874536.1 hypothetical protein [Paenarthrobacter sp. SD-1]QMU81461.1 hypothetical protein FV140_04380 [Paenarthrobacter ureafaciens]UYV93940.1 hypothetical protein NL395_04410 [Paenarthrobacter ureafaciens]UYV98467.1 hypothetical protein NL394_04355 [Paenarthrobacter ureafaciens]